MNIHTFKKQELVVRWSLISRINATLQFLPINLHRCKVRLGRLLLPSRPPQKRTLKAINAADWRTAPKPISDVIITWKMNSSPWKLMTASMCRSQIDFGFTVASQLFGGGVVEGVDWVVVVLIDVELMVVEAVLLGLGVVVAEMRGILISMIVGHHSTTHEV